MIKKKNKIRCLLLAVILALLAVGCDPMEEQSYGTANVSPMVEKWRPYVQEYAQKYGIGEYVELLLAMIAQESGGDADRYPDILQCSESAGAPPNSITAAQNISIHIYQYSSFCSKYFSSSAMGKRICSMLSRSRTVTVSFSRVSKSTVTQKGVPISSWRRYRLPIEPARS